MFDYVYLIHTDTTLDDLSLMDFVGKVGKGSNKRYKDYITPYGNRYLVSMIKVDHATSIETKIRNECKEKGYIKGRTETLYLSVSRSDTIDICIERYSLMISNVISMMQKYSDLVVTSRLQDVSLLSLIHSAKKSDIDTSNIIVDDYMNERYKGWNHRNEDVYKNIVRDGNLSALEYIYSSLVLKLPKEYIACAACEYDNMQIFEWTLSDITNYKMVILSAAQNNRLSFLQQMEDEIIKSREIVEIVSNISKHNDYKDIYQWISSITQT